MAVTEAGARLTEAHRLAQGRLGIETALQMIALGRVLDPSDIDATTAAWLRVAVPLVQRQHERSARLAAGYYQAFRTLELGPGFVPSVTLTANAERIIASLTDTGPAAVKAATRRGLPITKAYEHGVASSAGSAQRLALDGGRSTIIAAGAKDPESPKWRRVTSGSACKFCTELAARGAVYSSATSFFAAHDNCSCAAEPSFGDGRRQVAPFRRDELLTDEARAKRNAAIRRWIA